MTDKTTETDQVREEDSDTQVTEDLPETEYHAFSHRVVDSTDDEREYVPPTDEKGGS